MIQLTPGVAKTSGVAKTPGTANAGKTSGAKKTTLPKRPRLTPHHEMGPREFHKDWVLRVMGPSTERAAAVRKFMKRVMRYLDAKYNRGKTEFPGARVIEPGWTTPGPHDEAPKIDAADKVWEMPAGMCPVQIYGGMRMDPKGRYQMEVFDLLKACFDVDAPDIALRLT